jgi:hypothetical protein
MPLLHRRPLTMPEVLDRTLQKFGAVRVLIHPVAQFRAIASHLRATLWREEEEETDAAATAVATRDLIVAMDAATNAMNVCESHPLRAVFFHQFYRWQLTRAVDVLRRQFGDGADAAITDPVLQYIINATTAGVVASMDVPDADLINALDRLMQPAGSGLVDEFIQHLQRQGVVADGDDFRRQLHEMSGLPSRQRQPQNEPHIWQCVDALARIQLPIATIVPESGHSHHQDCTAVQRNIRNAITVQDFKHLYNTALDIGQLPFKFGIHADAYERWASDLTLSSASSPQHHAAALALHRHVCTVRLFYFELYRRYQSGWISHDELLDHSKWFINGLLHCLLADRAYTLVYRRLDWIRQNDLLSRGNNNGSFRLRRPNDGCCDEETKQKMATIHPIYESYVTMFPALVVNQPTILNHQRPASLSPLPAAATAARRSSSTTAAVTATVAAVAVVATTTETAAVWHGAGPNDGNDDDGHHVIVDGEMVLVVEEDDRGDAGSVGGGAP